MGLKYWPVMALVAAVFSLIPIFGSIASAVPAVAIGLTQGLGTAVFVLGWILGIHQLEANVLVPKIMERSVGVSPVAVMVALLIGGSLMGLVGAILAIPTAALLSVIIEEIAADRESRIQRVK